MMFDTRRVMKATSYHTVLFCSLAYKLTDDGEIREAEVQASNLLDKFTETNIVPDYIEEFCIGVLTGRIPIFDKKGRVLNKKGVA
jgi:hypothetical protein